MLHVPTGYDGSKRIPLVVDLHGYTSWATEQATRTKWGAKADTEGFIVVESRWSRQILERPHLLWHRGIVEDR